MLGVIGGLLGGAITHLFARLPASLTVMAGERFRSVRRELGNLNQESRNQGAKATIKSNIKSAKGRIRRGEPHTSNTYSRRPAGLVLSTLGAIVVLYVCIKLGIRFPRVG